jgi:hypothetical protein
MRNARMERSHGETHRASRIAHRALRLGAASAAPSLRLLATPLQIRIDEWLKFAVENTGDIAHFGVGA